ncbi:MAG TPA: UDP-N-acetylmuramate dehydrogenase [Terracidiphilus sp.]|jgi:UDP-N-acetylmuramate dehydrogenase|nr:UDP-N-acetylmuramate dehydrogenase [Terracidiphilus sp.]
MRVEENKSLAPFTTLGVGGPARWFAEAECEEDIAVAARWARRIGVPIFVLGGGSNLLVADTGFAGLVLHVGMRGVRRFEREGHFIYEVAAGEDWNAFVERSVADNCAGLECLAGIPGTVGGTPVQNVGAYGQEVASSIMKVRAYDLKTDTFVEFSNADCRFAYRCSRFNTSDRGRYVVTRVDYRLTLGGTPTLRYTDLQREFSARPDASLHEVADAVRRIRRSKGMLLVEGDPDCRSAGSFFKNPIVSENRIREMATACGKETPSFPAGPQNEAAGGVKIAAAWLIEQAGFAKGYTKGAAGISTRHTLALINRGVATAAEILGLADEIASAVEARFGIHLEREPVLLGFEDDRG